MVASIKRFGAAMGRALLPQFLTVAIIAFGVQVFTEGAFLKSIHTLSSLVPLLFYIQLVLLILVLTFVYACTKKVFLTFWVDLVVSAMKIRSTLNKGCMKSFSTLLLALDYRVMRFSKKMYKPVRLLSILALMAAIAVPWVGANATTAVSSISKPLVLQATEAADEVLKDIVILVQNDWSLSVMYSLLGSTVNDVKTDPFSLALLKKVSATLDPTSKFVTSFSNGLDFAEFDSLNPNRNPGDASSSSNTYTPDSFIGFLSLFLSLLFIILLTLAMIFRAFITVTISGVLQGDKKGASVKLMGSSLSAIFSMAGTLPIYKGYNILGLFLISCLVTGVGIANFAIILYFKFILVSSPMVSVLSPQSDNIYAAVLDKYVCINAINRSHAASLDIDGGKAISGDQFEYEINFGKCGTIKVYDAASTAFENMAASVYETSATWLFKATGFGVTAATKAAIYDVADLKFKKALSKLIIDTSSLVTEFYSAIDEQIAFEGSGEGSYLSTKSIAEILNVCKAAVAVTGVGVGYDSLTSEFQKICVTGGSSFGEKSQSIKDEFSKAIGLAAREAISEVEDSLSNKGIARSKSDGGLPVFEKLATAVTVDNTDSWSMYSAGWMKYPTYLSMSRNYASEFGQMFTMKVEKEIDMTEFSSSELDDFEPVMTLFTHVVKSTYNSAAYDPETTIKMIIDGDGSLAAVSERLGGLTGMDNEAVNWLSYWLSTLFIADAGQNAVMSLSESGHLIMGIIEMLYGLAGAADGMSMGAASKVADAATDLGGFVASAAMASTPWAGAIIGFAKGVSQPYMDLISKVLPFMFPFAYFMAYVLPSLVFYYFVLAFLKWVTQVLKTSIFTACVALKLWESQGNDVFGKETVSLAQQSVINGAMPTILISLFLAIEGGATPIINLLQVMWFENVAVMGGPHLVGIGQILLTVVGLVLIPFAVLFWLYALPISIQDTLPQFLSINLASFDASNGVSTAFGQIANIQRMMNASSEKNPADDKKTSKKAVDDGDKADDGDKEDKKKKPKSLAKQGFNSEFES